MNEDQASQLMADILKLSLIDGLSARAIARQLNVSRNTVRKYLGNAVPRRRGPQKHPRDSMLDEYTGAIKQLLEDSPQIKSPAVLERLRRLGYKGGISILRDYLYKVRPRRQAEAFLTLNFHPGSALQVDWADFGYAIPGCPRRVSALVMALCYSRYLYLEFTLSQTFGCFVRAMDRGLDFFGGTTQVDIFDNMKTVVLSHTAQGVRFNPQFLAYARARGFGVRACNVRKGNEKGLVERPIGFLRTRFWPGRRFTSLLDLNTQAAHWRDDFANNREHADTLKIPSLVYQHEEKPLLKPVSKEGFDTDDIHSASVTKRFRVRFDRNLYSVPPRLVGQTVVLRVNDEGLAVNLGPKQVAFHRRCWGIGEDLEQKAHRESALELKPRTKTNVMPPYLQDLGEVGADYFKILFAGKRSIKREIVNLTFLHELFGAKALTSAMQEVMATGHIGAEYVEYVLRHKRQLKPQAQPLKLGDPLLDALHFDEPNLDVYDEIVPPNKTLDPGEPPDRDTDEE